MTRFVNNANWTAHYAVRDIASIGKGKRRERYFGFYHEVKLRNGETIYLDTNEVDGLTNPVIAAFPAAPGYNTIETGDCSDGTPWTIREPVIAWQLMQAGEMVPVTIRGPDNGEHHRIAVEQPSGEIWLPLDDAIYPGFDEFRARSLVLDAQQEAERNRAAVEQAAKPDEKA